MFTLSVQALEYDARGEYKGISECEHTSSLYPTQIRIQVRCVYKVETMYNHNSTIFSWH